MISKRCLESGNHPNGTVDETNDSEVFEWFNLNFKLFFKTILTTKYFSFVSSLILLFLDESESLLLGVLGICEAVKKFRLMIGDSGISICITPSKIYKCSFLSY